MSQALKKSTVEIETFDLQATLLEIQQLLVKLGEKYQNQLTLMPTEILQWTHGLELFNKISLQQSKDPQTLFQEQLDFISDLQSVYLKFMHACGAIHLPSHTESLPDRHKQFAHQSWHTNPYLQFLKNLHILTVNHAHRWLHSLQGINHKTKEQLHFYVNNFLDSLAPTNQIWTNPEVMESIFETNGANLIRGFRNYLDDLVLNNGQLNVRLTDVRAFSVGHNLAITPGKVIFQNDLIQLIQYLPTTEQVQDKPILITPPFINKYYVLDLSPNNSLVKWLVNQGFTVYIISWINPGKELAEKTFENYMQEGPLAALDVVMNSSKAPSVHMVGYCIGGTILACTLAYLRSKQDKRVLSATFLMSLIDFSEPGEMGVFLDNTQLDSLDKLMQEHGYLNGRLLDMTFNLLRPNDLVWPYFINSYLLGKDIKPFDILYWNADSANLPYKMYSYYLRNMYLQNNLIKPGAITLAGVPLNLAMIDTPTFFLTAESDHITLWKAVYKGLNRLSGPVKLVLTESGHVRGVLNPEGDTKYNFTTNDQFNKSSDFVHGKAAEWLETGCKNKGSWWPYWRDWLLQHDNNLVPTRNIDAARVIEDAPGSYVQKRI